MKQKNVTLTDIHAVLIEIRDLNAGVRRDLIDIFKLLKEADKVPKEQK